MENQISTFKNKLIKSDSDKIVAKTQYETKLKQLDRNKVDYQHKIDMTTQDLESEKEKSQINELPKSLNNKLGI